MASDGEAAGEAGARSYIRALVIAALLGVPAALAAVIFTSVLHDLTHLVWNDVPDAAGWDEPPWWYVIAVPGLAGVVVAACLRLPGRGGHAAVHGLSLEPLGPLDLPSAVAAALATLALGLVLGPEGPLIAIGLTLGLMASRSLRTEGQVGQTVVLAGAFATISTVLGGPLTSALMLFEMLAKSGKLSGQALWRVMIPGFVAAGTGALVFTGVADWPGVHQVELAIPGLPSYPTLRLADLAWAVPVAVGSALAVATSRKAAERIAAAGGTRPEALLIGAGLLVGLIAVVFRAATDQPVDLVLFSGEESMSTLIAEDTGWVLVMLIAAKALAYALSLGGGFRGGPIFPTIAIGVAVGVLASVVLPDCDLTPAVAAGTAAGAAAALQLPIFGALLATLLVGDASADTVTVAVLASVIGWLVAAAIDARMGEGTAEGE